MRTTNLVTISLPPGLLRTSQKIATQKQMTRSELIREALRRYIEEQDALEAVRVYEQELHTGKLKKLKGSLVKLLD